MKKNYCWAVFVNKIVVINNLSVKNKIHIMLYVKQKNKVNNIFGLCCINSYMKKLCVVFGGESSEHDISIITGMQLVKKVKNCLKVESIYLGLNNKFYLATKAEDISGFEKKSSLKL